MEILGCIDYLAQRGEVTVTCSEVAFASDDLGIQMNCPAYDRRSYEQAIRECVAHAQAITVKNVK